MIIYVHTYHKSFIKIVDRAICRNLRCLNKANSNVDCTVMSLTQVKLLEIEGQLSEALNKESESSNNIERLQKDISQYK